MGLKDFLDTLLFWRTNQFHALATRPSMALVLGLSWSNSLPLWDNYSLNWALNRVATALHSSIIWVDVDRFLGFSNWTHIKGDIYLFQGLRLLEGPCIWHYPKAAPFSIPHNCLRALPTKVSLSIPNQVVMSYPWLTTLILWVLVSMGRRHL